MSDESFTTRVPGETDALLRTLIDTLPDSIYVKDANGRYILDNLAHMRHVGVASAADIVGKTVFDLFPKEVAERFDADDKAILRSETPLLNREEPIVDDDGTRRWISTTKVPFRDDTGRILGLVCLSRDITEEKRAKEDLLRAHAGLKQFPIIPCDLCGSQPTLQRKQIKLMLGEWEKRQPGRVESIFRSLQNVRPSHLLDRDLFDFSAIKKGDSIEAGHETEDPLAEFSVFSDPG